MTEPDPVDVSALASYLGVSEEEASLPGILDAAQTICEERLKDSGLTKCPISILNLAVLQLSADLWQRRQSSGGIYQVSGDGTLYRLARDAFANSAKPLLAPYMPIGAVG